MIRKTVSILLATIFLVSFTGMRLVMHHCSGCGTTEIVLASVGTDSCCGQTAGASEPGKGSASDMACCTPEDITCHAGIHAGCCQFEDLYLKGEFTLIIDKVSPRIDLPVVADAITPEPIDAAIHSTGIVATPYHVTNPPPRLAGRAFVLYSHQLKYC